jgi:hypothetical protein
MARIVYRVVQHDGGWAYKVGDVISETFPTREAAGKAAHSAAARQQIAGETSHIEYEDAQGRWHEEVADGHDRPKTDVE